MCANEISASFKFMRTSPQGDRGKGNNSLKSRTKQACYDSRQMRCLLGLFRIWWPQSIIWNLKSNIYYEQVQTMELGLNIIQQWMHVSNTTFEARPLKTWLSMTTTMLIPSARELRVEMRQIATWSCKRHESRWGTLKQDFTTIDT